MERKNWTLMVLAAAKGAALQPVQLQKVLFLLGKRLPGEVGGGFYSFQPYHYGPFDASVYHDAEELERNGFAIISRGRWKTYAATPAGIQRAHQLSTELPLAHAFIASLVEWALPLSFEQLVKAVYSEFPEFKQKSVFRD